MLFEALFTFVAAWLVWYILKPYIERRNMPPGPFPIPFLGNLHQTGTDIPFSLEDVRKKYGDLFTVTFPIGHVVVINSAELMKEALVTKKDDFSGRSEIALYPLEIVLENADIPTCDFGPSLMIRRKIFKAALHMLGDGLQETETRVVDVVVDLLDEIESTEGKPFSPKKCIAAAIIIFLWKWLSNEKCTYGDDKIEQLLDFNIKLTLLFANGNLHKLFPFLKYFPSQFHRTIEELETIKRNVYEPALAEHRKTYKEGVIRDITDSLLCAYDKEMQKRNPKDTQNVDVVKCLMIDVILGGADSASCFCNWFILYIILYPDLQKKLQDEVDTVVGRNRLPSLKDFPNMPLLEATVCEVFRHSSFMSVAIPHSTTRDTTLRGYQIKKDTMVFINLYAMNQDSRVWKEPREFRPERFIDDEGKFVGWSAYPGFLPFGIGRRSCLGDALAKLQLYIVTSFLLHRFNFEVVHGEPKPTLEMGPPGGIQYPKEYKCIAKRRA